MPTFLKILLRAIDDRVLVDLEHPDGGQTDAITQLPFTWSELSVLLRALEISRNVRDTFDRDEWGQLEAWGITTTSFTPDAGEEMWATAKNLLSEPLLKLIQAQLVQLLFSAEPARQLLNLALSQVQPREALHLQLHLPPGTRPEERLLSQYPWEVLSSPLPQWPNKRVAISRYLRMPRLTITPQPVDRLRILVVTARPGNLGVGEGSDSASMVTGLRRRLVRYPVQVRELPRATFDDLSDYLYEHDAWHILHFDGHGDFGRACHRGHLSVSASATHCPECGAILPGQNDFTGYLAFEREDGTADWISAEQLADLLLDHGLRLAVLNACNSAVGRRGDSVFNGLAQRLIRAGIPGVVATPFRLDWEAAVGFSRYLYQHLGQGEPLVEALDHSRRRLRHRRATPREWYRPALYLREADDSRGQLFNEPSETDTPLPDPETLRTLHIYAFQPPPLQPPERAFFWGRYFDKNRQPQRATPDPETWERALLPELQERKVEMGDPGTVYCPLPVPLSVGLAIGHTFPRVGRYRLGIVQTPPDYWFSDAKPDDEVSFRPTWAERTLPGNPEATEAILIIYAVKGRDRVALVRTIGEYWQEVDVFQQLVAKDDTAETKQPSQRFRQVMLLQAEPATTEDRFLYEWETAELAFNSRPYLDRLARGVKIIHFILIGSASMATFLGHQWNAKDTTLQFYEWVADEKKYSPSIRLQLG